FITEPDEVGITNLRLAHSLSLSPAPAPPSLPPSPARPPSPFVALMEHGAGGNAWIMDRNAKHKLRALSLSLLEEDQEIHVPRLLTPEKAAKEAAKEDQLVNAARAKMAESVSHALLLTTPAPGSAPVVGGSAPPAQSSAPAPGP
ncbi:unnamed protein product, partial [Urochloa humidicola]